MGGGGVFTTASYVLHVAPRSSELIIGSLELLHVICTACERVFYIFQRSSISNVSLTVVSRNNPRGRDSLRECRRSPLSTEGCPPLTTSLQLGMGLGGPFGGFISDSLGWRWAFLIQLPLFAISLFLTTVNLRYPTPVSVMLEESDILLRLFDRVSARTHQKRSAGSITAESSVFLVP